MRYAITEALGVLAADLRVAGYTGEIKLTTHGATGTDAEFEGSFIAMELTGFCKETLYISYDKQYQHYVLVGRYNSIDQSPEVPTIETLTRLAWTTYRSYKKSKDWGRPMEWEALFKHYGYLTTKTVEQLVEKGD